MKVDE
jgi:hypothetical protein